ncbi:RNA polymerase I-specific transcription initiation factor RRN6-like protein [Boeremia exigua]|uniref:RNA polymerase I-specific transcription initiation factor RRN6-like protein n=1 Tax=Boeremia exigua TaxID=749465 RepID=UPI001E8E8D9B|nr:RNA polymerase I-specific transcription initiation factor RRN6-like protein [Boeremia exigua]KAH6614292.1 RNA polymerase I-specific transcription initiation factor RRN6-like protein [Boeremia exigua]
MADSSLHDLNYGRPGLRTYDLDDREWNSPRYRTSNALKQVSQWQLSIPAATTCLPTGVLTNTTKARKDVRRLTQNHLQLAPAAKELPEINAVSEAVISAASTYDPNVGDLLSFGTVYLKKWVRPRRIAAAPTGPSGSILRLVPLDQQRQGWEGDKSVWLTGPSFRIVDSGYWNEEATPIQQICFGHADSGNSFLAVRLLSKTVLFRPLYHRGRRAAPLSPYYDLPPSLLSARPILSILPEQTGGAPHADVSFNPDYQFQFGIVDQHYQWSLWQIERRAKREEYSVSRMVRGDIMPEHNDTDDGDGWARIFWAGDSNTLIVCNRRHLSVVGVKGETFEYLQAPIIIPQRSTDWILEIRRHPQHQDCFFVLTSTRLFLIAVTTTSAAIDSTVGEAGASILLSRRHYRGGEDITLQASVQTLEATTCLFITSRLNKLVQVYHFEDFPPHSAEPIISTDPVTLGFEPPTSAGITQLHIQPLEYGTKIVSKQQQLNAAAQSFFEKAVPFYQLTVVLADLSVYQTVLLSSQYDPAPEPLVWRRIVVAKHSIDARADIDEMGSFVEPNGPDWDAEPESKLEGQSLQLVKWSDQAPALATADCTTIYGALVRDDHVAGESITLEALTDQVQGLLRGDLVGLESRHFMENLDSVLVSDVDEGSAKVDRLFADDGPQNTHSLRPIASTAVLRLPETEHASISDLYDTILRDWIAPLPKEIPVPVRQAKERLARRIAAEVTLAGAQLTVKEEEHSAMVPGQSLSLPILPSNPPDLLPTPPQSSVPPSSPSLPEYPQPPTSDPLSRLRKHLKINDDSATPPIIIAPSVSELLSHWQPGTDPSIYDWEATERTLRPEMLDEESQELRERERKKKERREKRQKREDELMRAKSQTTTLPTFARPAIPRSSPGPTFGGMAASSQVAMPASSQVSSQVQGQGGGFGGFGGVNSMVPQSQVEPGRFGGRPDKKKKKGKSRVSGF